MTEQQLINCQISIATLIPITSIELDKVIADFNAVYSALQSKLNIYFGGIPTSQQSPAIVEPKSIINDTLPLKIDGINKTNTKIKNEVANALKACNLKK